MKFAPETYLDIDGLRHLERERSVALAKAIHPRATLVSWDNGLHVQVPLLTLVRYTIQAKPDRAHLGNEGDYIYVWFGNITLSAKL